MKNKFKIMDGIMIRKIKFFIEYFKYLNNPIAALQFKFGFKKKCIIKIKNKNLAVELKNVSSIDKLMNLMRTVDEDKCEELINYIDDIDHEKEIIVIDDINYINVYTKKFMKNNPYNFNICIEEYFSGDEWNMINLENRYIIDIGANIGDTALYFAKEKAKVLAFEPVKHLYELGMKNLSLNPEYKENIRFINKGVGGKRGELNINSDTTKTYINNADNYSVEVITIKDILNEYEFPADILKMDCEGCEFEIILNEDLTMFTDIIFEHHSKQVGKDYKQLIKKLKEEGFKINTYDVIASSMSFEDIGIIHAFK